MSKGIYLEEKVDFLPKVDKKKTSKEIKDKQSKTKETKTKTK